MLAMTLIELMSVKGSPARSHTDRIYGVVVGIVKDISDPQNLGRVRVDFPWLADADDDVPDPEKKKGSAYSNWARIATLMAGNKRGTYFIPEVGDEVLVAFEHGHINRPMIIGSLWNSEDKPPEQMDGDAKNDVRSITSRGRGKLKGHKIILNDSEENPSITIVDTTGENSIFIDSKKNAMTIKVKGDLSIEVGGNLSIKAMGKIDIKADQDIAAEAQANLTLKATGNGNLESQGPLNVKSSAQISMDGTGQAEVKATMVSVNGSGMTEVKGAVVKIN
jgi:uncharacterized protein involved in type VI secretion and phage assembly